MPGRQRRLGEALLQLVPVGARVPADGDRPRAAVPRLAAEVAVALGLQSAVPALARAVRGPAGEPVEDEPSEVPALT